MTFKNISGKTNTAPEEWARYFGLAVQVVVRMKSYSLIRWRDREFIVDSQDLQLFAERAA
jgi:hypothetical protein